MDPKEKAGTQWNPVRVRFGPPNPGECPQPATFTPAAPDGDAASMWSVFENEDLLVTILAHLLLDVRGANPANKPSDMGSEGPIELDRTLLPLLMASKRFRTSPVVPHPLKIRSRYVLIVCFFEDGSYWPSHDTPPSDLDWSCYNGNLRDPGFHPLLKAKIAEIEEGRHSQP